MGLICPWGCGWKGSAIDYSEHYDECPARVCPKCGSTDVLFYRKEAIECLTCGNRWPRKEVPEAPEIPAEVPVEEKPEVKDEELAPKIFKTEEEFRSWLEKHGVTAEPRPHAGLFKDDKRVGSYFETAEGIQVDLAEDAKTWLIRDEVFVEVEAGEEAMVEKPLETPVKEEAGESSGETAA